MTLPSAYDMTTFMIGYDLNKAGKNYADLIAEIKEIGNGWWHHLDSTWLVVTDLSAVEIRDRLRPHLDSDDELLVAKISAPGAWAGFKESGSQWLLTNL